MNLPINSSKLQWTAQDGSPPTTCQTTARPLTNGLSYWSVVCDWGLSLDSYTQNLSENWRYTTNGASTDPLGVDCHSLVVYLGQSWAPTLGPSSRTLGWSFGDVCMDVLNPNMIFYDFTNFQVNFIKNKHVKLDETWLDTQGRFKEKL